MKPSLSAVFWFAAAVVAGSAAAGCGSSGDLPLCGQIPEGGCPIGRGGTCDDLACAALYDCVEAAWTVVESCPGGGGAGGAGGEGGSGGEGGGGCEPVVIDRTGEASGCEPDLQSPDCPASAAEVCAASACLTDCSDFYLCTADGWADVAYCDPDGELVLIQ